VNQVLVRALEWAPMALLTPIAMEAWAAFVHGRLWHGVLWRVHASHHRARTAVWEENDALSLTHAPLAVALVLFGCRGAPGALREVAFGIGIGMTVFGAAYVVVHDGLVHGRLGVRGLLRAPVLGPYLCGVVEAHRRHHQTLGARFGLFLGPWELRRRERATARAPNPKGPQP